MGAAPRLVGPGFAGPTPAGGPLHRPGPQGCRGPRTAGGSYVAGVLTRLKVLSSPGSPARSRVPAPPGSPGLPRSSHGRGVLRRRGPHTAGSPLVAGGLCTVEGACTAGGQRVAGGSRTAEGACTAGARRVAEVPARPEGLTSPGSPHGRESSRRRGSLHPRGASLHGRGAYAAGVPRVAGGSCTAGGHYVAEVPARPGVLTSSGVPTSPREGPPHHQRAPYRQGPGAAGFWGAHGCGRAWAVGGWAWCASSPEGISRPGRGPPRRPGGGRGGSGWRGSWSG